MQVKQVLLVEGGVNLLIAFSKLAVGLFTNSAAIVADGLHSFTDLANNILAWMAVKISTSPADKRHPYGHQKFEQLAVFVLATFLTIVAFEILVSSVKADRQPVEQNFWGLLVLTFALLADIALAMWERYWAQRLGSDILDADASHTISDVLTSIAVIVGWQLASMGYYWIDAGFAIAVSLVIFYLAFKLFQKAIPILVDSSDLDAPNIANRLLTIDGVCGVRRVRSRMSGKHRTADVIAETTPSMSVLNTQKIVVEIQQLLAKYFDIDDVVIQIEPYKQT